MHERNDIDYDRRSDVTSGSGVSPWLVAALLVAVAALLLGYFRPNIRTALHDPGAKPRPVVARGDLADDEQATIELFRTARRSVVHITSLAVERDRMTLNLAAIPRGTGTGFIWSDEGHIVTNYHVIANSAGAKVRLADGATYNARYVGGEAEKDIAVLKIDAPASDLPPILVGESADLAVGQKVFAIGNPFGLDHTLTTGVISGLGREIPVQDSVSGATIRNVIQTDAAINPGNSGGPLLDSAGRLIGMNSAIYSTSGSYAGVGFAIPVDDINRIVPQIMRTGRAERAGLGIQLASDDTYAQFAGSWGLPETGALIVEVVPDSAAEEAGLRPTRETRSGIEWGDVIVAIDGRRIEKARTVFDILSDRSAGDEITITVVRDGEPVELKARLRLLPMFEG
ncbi:MAG: trypsin-like peptidase domain-containing protein [Planctomycetaceae bacterium]|nr:trypsin-like peptidase domain-containing protein [Planctomycetaceae bacterium]